MFGYLNNDGKRCGFSLILGEKWSDAAKKPANRVIASIFSHVDINKNDIIDREDITLLQRLLQIADSLNPNKKAEDKTIEQSEIENLSAQINEKKIDIEKLKQEAIDKSAEDPYPNSKNITDTLKFKSKSGYKAQVFNTNAKFEYPTEKQGITPSVYNTYTVKLTDKNNDSDTKVIKFQFNDQITDESIKDVLEFILNNCDKNTLDMMSNEVDNVIIDLPKDTQTYTQGFIEYSYNEHAHYNPGDENIVINTFNLDTIIHELGHAKHNRGGYFSAEADKLYGLISDSNKNIPGIISQSPFEMYAELFKDFSVTQNSVKDNITKKYGDILSKLTPEETQEFIQNLSILVMCKSKNITVASVLDMINNPLTTQKFNPDDLNRVIKLTWLDQSGLNNSSEILKLQKKNPSISNSLQELLMSIAYDYNESEQGIKREIF